MRLRRLLHMGLALVAAQVPPCALGQQEPAQVQPSRVVLLPFWSWPPTMCSWYDAAFRLPGFEVIGGTYHPPADVVDDAIDAVTGCSGIGRAVDHWDLPLPVVLAIGQHLQAKYVVQGSLLCKEKRTCHLLGPRDELSWTVRIRVTDVEQRETAFEGTATRTRRTKHGELLVHPKSWRYPGRGLDMWEPLREAIDDVVHPFANQHRSLK